MPRFKLKPKHYRFFLNAFRFLSGPIALVFLTYSQRVHPAYNLGWMKRILLGARFWWNTSRVRSGTSWRAHMVIAMKLLETPPGKPGCVVECGCYKGSATINLSLICKLTGRRLKVYDSFEGLPRGKEGDPNAAKSWAKGFIPGFYKGEIDEVKGNVSKYGAIDVCEFHKGWFEDTLPAHEGDIVLAYFDVDFFASLHDCLINLWPHVVEGGVVCIDDFRDLSYCAVFYSEKFWGKYFGCPPPGLYGPGTGVQVGMFFTSVWGPMGPKGLHAADSVAYTIKGNKALWDYYPDEIAEKNAEAADVTAA